MKVLIVLTSHNELGNTGEKTGFWVEELISAYYILSDGGLDISIVSPKGGHPPIDPKSELPNEQVGAMIRFNCDQTLKDQLAYTRKLSAVLGSDYDAVFYPGGHGCLWDLAEDLHSIALLESFNNQNKPIALVGHAVAALINAKNEHNEPLVKGRRITGFSDSEEKANQLNNIVPFLLEDRLRQLGALYSKNANDKCYTVQDGLLITGQNPVSAAATAALLLNAMSRKAPPIEKLQEKHL